MKFLLPIGAALSLLPALSWGAHWAFEAVQPQPPPEVKQKDWVRNPIDQFILHRLEAEGMQPASPADPYTLARRATIDLTGLAPAYETTQRFRADASEPAYQGLLDELLASPAYGERWGRHWLDVARYADTRGYLVAGQETRYPFAYTYRDYVIRSFNEDKPYDQFILEQLAADQLDKTDPANRAAMGFLTVGRRFINKRAEIIDDRIDVTTRGFMGLTVYCARCHDHKYDPVPTEDYYSLYSIFDNSEEPKELPLLHTSTDYPGYQKYKVEHDKRKKAIEDLKHKQHADLKKELEATFGNYLQEIARQKYPQHYKNLPEPEYIKKNSLRRAAMEQWKRYLVKRLEQPDPVLGILPVLAKISPDQFATQAPDVIKTHQPLLPALRERLAGASSMPAVLTRYASIWKSGELPDFRKAFTAKGAPLDFPFSELHRFQDRKMRENVIKLEKKVVQWDANSPDAPPRAMVMRDKEHPHDNHVFLRGNAAQRGPKVSRQFLEVLAPARKPYTQGSGRLELARSIAQNENPLTYRVLVNRVWHHHFGRGLVDTPDDFGTRGQQPSHPALLDYLSHWFVQNGKSIKGLHRLIMSSTTYRQASVSRHDYGLKDPDNRLLSRMNRQRLSFEAMRDQMLQASGTLDRKLGGQPLELWGKSFSKRRSVYGFIDRQKVPEVFRTFDFSNPDSVTGKRPSTIVPQQALFSLNSPFMHEMAAALTSRSKAESADKRIQALYQLTFARDADAAELKSARDFLAGGDETRWQSFAQVLLISNDFTFVD